MDGTRYLVSATYAKNGDEQTLPARLGEIKTSEQGSKLIIDSTDSGFVGDVEIKFNFALQDYLEGSNFATQVTLKVTPMPPPEQFVLGAKPGFDMTGIEISHEIAVGDAWQFTLPPTTHDNTEPIEVKYETVDFKSSQSFVNYDEKEGVLSIEENFTTLINMGQHQIKLQLVDADGKHSDWLEISLKIVAPKEESAEEKSIGGADSGITVIDEAIGLQYASYLEERLSKAEAIVRSGPIPPPPRAEISKISPLGLVKITFTNSMMKLPDEIKITPDGIKLDLPPTGRVLSSEVISTDGFKVRVIPAEGSQPGDLNLDWSIVSY